LTLLTANIPKDDGTANARHSAAAILAIIIMKKNLPLIRLSAVNPFLTELVGRGIDARQILREMDLPEKIPASSELFVSSNAMYRIVERAGELSNDALFGYKIGSRTDLGDWSPMARAVSEAKTVADLLSRFIVYALEHSSSTKFFLKTEGERATFGLRRLTQPPVVPAHNDAFYVGLISKMLSSATHAKWQPSAVLFQIVDPISVPNFEDGLRIVKGDSLGIRASFPSEWLFEKFEKSAFRNNLIGVTDTFPPQSLLESMRMALRPHLHEPNLSVDRAAAICGYQTRKLAALLRAEGTTVGKELSKLRAARAQEELTSTDSRIFDVAKSVGFSDATVFSRAFKNWTGESPQNYRKHNA
jgi:AraC-like DNA-binding protein